MTVRFARSQVHGDQNKIDMLSPPHHLPCLMPDHLQLVRMGLLDDSNQRSATGFPHVRVNRLSAPIYLQHQAYCAGGKLGSRPTLTRPLGTLSRSEREGDGERTPQAPSPIRWARDGVRIPRSKSCFEPLNRLGRQSGRQSPRQRSMERGGGWSTCSAIPDVSYHQRQSRATGTGGRLACGGVHRTVRRTKVRAPGAAVLA